MRVYQEGAVLLSHVDRQDTHALSLIINVDQAALGEPWPVRIRSHRTGEDVDVLLAPGAPRCRRRRRHLAAMAVCWSSSHGGEGGVVDVVAVGSDHSRALGRRC